MTGKLKYLFGSTHLRINSKLMTTGIMLLEFLIALGGFIVSMIIAGWIQNAANNRRYDRLIQLILSENEKLRGDLATLHGIVIQQDRELRDFVLRENKGLRDFVLRENKEMRDFVLRENKEMREDIRNVDKRVAGQEGYLRAIWSGVYGEDTERVVFKPAHMGSLTGSLVSQ